MPSLVTWHLKQNSSISLVAGATVWPLWGKLPQEPKEQAGQEPEAALLVLLRSVQVLLGMVVEDKERLYLPWVANHRGRMDWVVGCRAKPALRGPEGYPCLAGEVQLEEDRHFQVPQE